MRISSLISHRNANRMKQCPATGVVAPLIAAAAGAGGMDLTQAATVGGNGW
jgi:hypothetical protein